MKEGMTPSLTEEPSSFHAIKTKARASNSLRLLQEAKEKNKKDNHGKNNPATQILKGCLLHGLETERLKARKGPKTNPIWKGITASWSHDRQTDQEGGNPLVHRKTHHQLRLEGVRNRCPIARQSRISIALLEIFEKKLGNQGGSGLEKTSLPATTLSTEDYPLGLKDCQRKLS